MLHGQSWQAQAHSSSWISEEKLCGKTSPFIRQKICVKISWPHPPSAKKIAKGAYTDTKLYIHSRGQSKPAASFSDVTLGVKNEDVTNDMT